MPITRTPMVDDDGSGTSGTVVNNNWKVELYDQIDGALGPNGALPAPGAVGNLLTSTGAAWASQPNAGGYTTGTWLPNLLTDAGPVAGQTYVMREGFWLRIGSLCFIHGRISFSAIGSPMYGATTFLAGLPFTVSRPGFLTFPYWANLGTAMVALDGYGYQGTQQFVIMGLAAAAVTRASATGSVWANNTDIMFGGQFQV